MALNPGRPNTGVDDAILHENVILCCGEDTNDLLDALGSANPGRYERYHEYRCFRFWRFPAFTLIWSGMGSGCLEPLLFEILSCSNIRRIVLIGTAGALSTKATTLGDAHWISRAYLGASGIQTINEMQPVFPRFDLGRNREPLDPAEIISTDYYFGFSRAADPRIAALQNADPRLRQSLRQLWGLAELIDMETAQFFQLCSLLGSPELQYAAIKGPANNVSEPSQAIADVLRKAVDGAFATLDIHRRVLPTSTLAPAPSPGKAQSGETAGAETKLMEEIKLYWTIQLAVGGILGYLGSNLTFARAGAEKNIYLCGVSMLLIAIGAIYNIIGNYYSRMEGLRAGRSDAQENLFTPTIAIAYLLVSALLGGILTFSLNAITGINPNAFSESIKGMILGVLLNWVVCRRVFRELIDNGPESYRAYSAHLRALYLYY